MRNLDSWLAIFIRLIHGLRRQARGALDVFRGAYARAGIWWLIFAISMIALAANFVILAFYLLRLL